MQARAPASQRDCAVGPANRQLPHLPPLRRRGGGGRGSPPVGNGDGGPAIDATFQTILGIDVGPDGSVYIADRFAHRIRKIDPDGTIHTIAGTGQAGFSGDEGPATAAQIHNLLKRCTRSSTREQSGDVFKRSH